MPAGETPQAGFGAKILRAVGRSKLMKLLKRVVLILAGVAALSYLADYAALQIPIPKGRAQFATVTVRAYYDVGLKSGKSEFYFLDPRKQTCVNSLFPHLGYTPCWYLRGHTRQKISM